MKNIQIEYFAALRDLTGKNSENLATDVQTLAELYEHLKQHYQLTLNPSSLKVAVNDEFKDWQLPLNEGDKVVFIPPVAGG